MTGVIHTPCCSERYLPVRDYRQGAFRYFWTSRYPRADGGYVVIDNDDFGISPFHPFIQTDGNVGLTQANVHDAIELLRRNICY